MNPIMKAVDIILLFNFLLFYTLIIFLVKWQKKHPEQKIFTEKKFSLILVSFFYLCHNNNIDSFADLRFSYCDRRCDFASLALDLDLLVDEMVGLQIFF
jgi:hypothetical protein